MLSMDPTQEIRIQIKNGRNYYANYQEYKKLGNLTKASELLWGVVAAALNVVALSNYDFKPTTHDDYRLVMEKIMSLDPSEAIMLKLEFEAAERLHSNFYHGWMTTQQFSSDSRMAEALIGYLEQFSM